jgi:hypothetical protein
MQTNTKFYSIWADANAVGGFLEEPVRNIIPTVAPVSLPAVGGLTAARSEAFTFERIVSVSSAYTRVSGQEDADGSVSILATSVVEGLNILEVIQADRIVAQVSITVASTKAPIRVSKAGSQFYGLKWGVSLTTQSGTRNCIIWHPTSSAVRRASRLRMLRSRAGGRPTQFLRDLRIAMITNGHRGDSNG